jgi:hypothetical protein
MQTATNATIIATLPAGFNFIAILLLFIIFDL